VKKWLTSQENQALIKDVERQLEEDRDFAESSPMPEPESAAGGIYCESGCHDVKPKYATPKVSVTKLGASTPKHREAAVHLK